ncbi:MAG: sulfite exporter TauE/SafE family protein [Candidatus Omnitrophica bacterium]|nr:sulfite exporter TauE/SafE family protein [Candidatus Omnitrophota bacterium]MBU1869262.1 sulfite exporter TauE/SafE family protein [Candidatus Omnitrophota bacterium]
MTPSGNNIDFFIAFFGGIVFSFSPCVYPLLPISAGFIGSVSSGSKLKGLVLSLIYVFGIAITYSLLGLAAILSGKIFGSVASSPFINIAVGILIIFFGLAMLEVFTINLPHHKIIKLPVFKKHGYFSVFVIGLTSGFLVAPCVTPALGSILAYLAAKKNLVYGTLLLFSFAFGMGFTLILAGTFAGILANFPKSGKWMEHIKKAFALLLIAAGVYFIFSAIQRI